MGVDPALSKLEEFGVAELEVQKWQHFKKIPPGAQWSSRVLNLEVGEAIGCLENYN